MSGAFADPSRADALHRAIVETSPYFYCVLDHNARFTFVSAASRDMLGYEPEALVGKLAFEYVHPSQRSYK